MKAIRFKKGERAKFDSEYKSEKERAKEIFIQKEDGDKPTYIQEITPEEEDVMYCII